MLIYIYERLGLTIPMRFKMFPAELVDIAETGWTGIEVPPRRALVDINGRRAAFDFDGWGWHSLFVYRNSENEAQIFYWRREPFIDYFDEETYDEAFEPGNIHGYQE